LLFFVGRFADKYGQKKILIIAAVLLSLACFWNSFVTGLWMLFIGFFVSRFTGQGSMNLLPSAIIPQWFVKKRALAISIMSLGSITASAVVPPVNIWLIGIWGWQSVWWLWGILLFLLFIPVTFYLLFDKPSELGLCPDNETAAEAQRTAENTNDVAISFSVKEAMHTRAFWGILFCHLLLPMVSTGVVFHFISIAGSKGLAETTAAFVLSLFAVVSFPATLLSGFVLDRIKMHHVAAMMCVLQLASLLVLLLSSSVFVVCLFAVLQGAAIGLYSVSAGVVWPNYYGTKCIGSIRGIGMAAVVIGSAAGPVPFGFVYDAFGDYSIAIILMMVFSLIGVVAALLSPKPVKKLRPS
jgi:MFS family permease